VSPGLPLGQAITLMGPGGEAVDARVTAEVVGDSAAAQWQVRLAVEGLSDVAGFSAQVEVAEGKLHCVTARSAVTTSGRSIGCNQVSDAGRKGAAAGASLDAPLRELATFTFLGASRAARVRWTVRLYDAHGRLVAQTAGAGTAEAGASGCPGLLGDLDCDGEPTVGDAIKILRIAVGLDPDDERADVNCSGAVDVGDAIRVLRCAVGLDQWPIGTAEAQAINEAATAISQAFDEGFAQGGPPAAIAQGKQAADADPAVEATAADTSALWVKYRGGGVDVWDISPPPAEILGSMQAAQVSPEVLKRAAEYVGSQSILIVNVVSEEVDPEFAPASGALRALYEQLRQIPGFTVEMVEGHDATVEAFKALSTYGIVILVGHGRAQEDTPGFPSGPCVQFQTGEEAPLLPELFTRYWMDWLRGRMARMWIGVGPRDECGNPESIACYWAVTEDFFSHYYADKPAFPHTVFYSGSCQGLKNDEMAKALHDLGVAAYLGWTEVQGKSPYTAGALFPSMFCGQSLEQAFLGLPEDLRYQSFYYPPAGCPGSEHYEAYLQYYPGDAGTLQLTDWCPPPFACSEPYYDDVASALRYMGREADMVPLHGISSSADLAAYSMYAVNCANGLEETSQETAQALADFVAAGGRLYASDWAFAVTQKAFPGKITVPEEPYCGSAMTVTASVVNPVLRNLLGGRESVELTYDLGAWVPLTGVGPDVDVLLEGEYETYEGWEGFLSAAGVSPSRRRDPHTVLPLGWLAENGTRTTGPLAVAFNYGNGKVMHTTFHYHAQVGVTQLALLNYLLLSE